MSYKEYAARVPAGKLNLVLDEEHLAKIADATDDWDTDLALFMGLPREDLRDIWKNPSLRENRPLQR